MDDVPTPPADPNEDRPGTLAYRLTGYSTDCVEGVWIDGEFVGIGDEIEIRSAPVDEIAPLLSAEVRAELYIRRLESGGEC